MPIAAVAVVGEYIFEPRFVLAGVRAWPIARGADGRCPVCGDGPRTASTACLVCDRASPELEAKIAAARIKIRARERAEHNDRQVHDELRKQTVTRLTECERRRIFNGGVGGVLAATAEPTNRARIGRAFLKEIGQEPDWSIELKIRPRPE